MSQETFAEKEKMVPVYSGTLQTDSRDPKTRKTLGRILLWESKSLNPKAPVMYGSLQTKYGKSSIALWKFSPRQKDEKSDAVI